MQNNKLTFTEFLLKSMFLVPLTIGIATLVLLELRNGNDWILLIAVELLSLSMAFLSFKYGWDLEYRESAKRQRELQRKLPKTEQDLHFGIWRVKVSICLLIIYFSFLGILKLFHLI